MLEKDVVILRFIFKCGSFELHEVQKFDEMFRDYTNNLKRRYTEGFRLEGHVGVYIPQKQEHYIDATLIFQNDKHISNRIEQLNYAVAQYWKNYVENKWDQIHEHKKKQKNSKFKSDVNPFSCFENRRLIAQSMAVVKTESLLNQGYVEIFQGQQKVQKLLIDKISLYYAHSPVILVSEEDYTLMPRKNCLILGRVREPHKKNSILDNSNTKAMLSDQADIVSEPDANILSVQQTDHVEQSTNNELHIQGTQINDQDENISLNQAENYAVQTKKNTTNTPMVKVPKKKIW